MASYSSKRTWLLAAGINLIILAVILAATDMLYETNDDYAIASRIVDGYAAVNFVNYYLCRILVGLQALTSAWNVYVIFQIAASWFSFTCITKMIMDRSTSSFVTIFALAVISVFAADHYCTIQFTKTSALVLAAGFIVMADSFIYDNGVLYYIISVLLLYTGVALRADGLLPAIAYAGLYLIWWLIACRNDDKGKHSGETKFLTPKRLGIFVILIALTGGCFVFDHMSYIANTKGEELSRYKAYSEARSSVVDFGVYDRYDENAVKYDEIGISGNDLYLIDNWYFDYDGAAGLDNLEKIVAIDASSRDKGSSTAAAAKSAVKSFIKHVIKAVRNLSFSGLHLILLFIIAAWMMLILKPRHILYIFAVGGLTAALYIALYYMQRPAYRAFYIADISAAMWLMYAASVFYIKNDVSRKKAAAHSVAAVIAVTAALLMLVPMYSNCRDAYQTVQKKVMPAELAEYIEKNDSDFFVFSTTEKKSGSDYIKPWKAPATAKEKNVMGTGSWGTMSPYVLDKLAAYGLTNPIKDLTDNDKAYYIGNKRIGKLEKYYNKWYGGSNKKIHLEKVRKIGGYNIWKVISE